MMESLINIQPFSTQSDPIYLQGTKLISKEEATSLRLQEHVIPNGSFKEIFKSENISIRQCDDKVQTRYIIYGNVEQRDIRGRKIAFSCYLETACRKTIKSILNSVNECLAVVDYSIVIPPIPVEINTHSEECRSFNKKTLFYIAMSLTAGIAVGYIIYQGVKNLNNDNSYEQSTNQIVQGDSIC